MFRNTRSVWCGRIRCRRRSWRARDRLLLVSGRRLPFSDQFLRPDLEVVGIYADIYTKLALDSACWFVLLGWVTVFTLASIVSRGAVRFSVIAAILGFCSYRSRKEGRHGMSVCIFRVRVRGDGPDRLFLFARSLALALCDGMG